MIRLITGFLIIMGAVGADDFAMETGIVPPPLMQTFLLCMLGFALIGWAMPKLIRQSENH